MVDQLVINGHVVATFEVEDAISDLVKDFDLSFEVTKEAELRALSVVLGGIDRYRVGASGNLLAGPHDVKTTGGRDVDVFIWLAEELMPQRPVTPPSSAVERVRAEAARARDEAAAPDLVASDA